MKRKTRGGPVKPAAKQRLDWRYGAGVVVVAIAITALVATKQFGGGTDKASVGLPHTSDYHSLLVSPTNSRQLLLGTHQGLYQSRDGGLNWRFAALAGNDAMNLARPGGQTIWLAGHNVFKKSIDGGANWQDVRPSGLPSLDIHGFTVDRVDHWILYAAIAGRGLYRSNDAGRSFTVASSDVGGNVVALAVTADKRLLAGDGQRGLLQSSDQGRSWKTALAVPVLGLAVNPSEPGLILATDAGSPFPAMAERAGDRFSTFPKAPARSPGRRARRGSLTSSASIAPSTALATAGRAGRP